MPQALLRDNTAEALAKAARFQDIFGRDSFFIEMQDHGIPEQHRINPQLLEIARKLDAPLLATNDSHYTHRADAAAHDALLCVQTGSLLEDTDRLKFHGDEHYMKTAAEMRSLFAELPESCDNTLLIAERADVNIEFGTPRLPHFDVPEGFDNDRAYLQHLTYAGAHQRWGDPLPADVAERLAFELEVINSMGFCLLLPHHLGPDRLRPAQGHPGGAGPRLGRGLRGGLTACASPTSTRSRYDLLFERFLNPSRVSMPDIDMDFDSRHRDEMINYAAQRYGARPCGPDHHLREDQGPGRGARRSPRAGLPPLAGRQDRQGHASFDPGPRHPAAVLLRGIREPPRRHVAAAELRQMYDTEADVAKVVDVARGIEGMRRQDGIHAAAVVITPEPLTEYMPIQRKPEQGRDPSEAPIVTQYEMHGVEDLGLLKMDFLGLRNLDVITDTVEWVERTRGVVVDIDSIPLDDDATFKMLQEGDTIGVFQLENPQVRSLVRSLAPTAFDDICALVALYRPGPMAANMHHDYADRKNGRRRVEYFHDDASDILADTYD